MHSSQFTLTLPEENIPANQKRRGWEPEYSKQLLVDD